MGKLSIKRVTLTGEVTKIEFDKPCGKYMIKNFSDNDIYVSFDENFNEAEAAKIASNYGQVVIGNLNFDWTTNHKTNSIYIKGAGEVEVQQLCY